MQISEPVTMLTDYAIALVCFVFAVRLGKMIGPRTKVSVWFWCAGFVATGIAAAIGGTFDGFATYFETGTHRALWNLTIYAVGASGAFMTAGVHAAYIRREDGTVRWLVLGILVTIIGGIVQQSGIRRGEHFNHNDVYHLIQIVGLYFFFRCAQTVRDRPGIPA
jgi:hypothetical protein